MEGPDEIEPPEGISKNAARSRSLDVGGRVTVEAARAEVRRLVRMFVAVVACRHPWNRKGGRDALDNAFLVALASINHPYVSGERERDPCRMPAGEEKTEGPILSMQSKTREDACARDQPVP